MKALYFLPLMALMVGCATTLPPRYTVANEAQTKLTRDAASLSVRMAADLRTYHQPLIFNADGTVNVYRDISYYAPLEIAIERALHDATVFNATAHAPLRITVRDFCIDARGDRPMAKVTLKMNRKVLTKTAPLSLDYTPGEVRDALGSLLLSAYTEL